MKKKIDHAFGKDIYLLGTNSDGKRLWLEAPSWDCKRYWGFGYVETYTNERSPSSSKDISSHSHISSMLKTANLSDSLSTRTFSDKEGWELSELFAQFYHLKTNAEFWNRGKMHIASTDIQSFENKELAKHINEVIIPIINARILSILTP